MFTLSRRTITALTASFGLSAMLGAAAPAPAAAGRRVRVRSLPRYYGLRYRPGDADHRGAANIFPDRRAADSDRSSDHPLARPTGVLQAQNFSNLPHRQSLGGHQTSLCESQKEDLARRRLPTTFPTSPHQQGGRFRSDWVAAFRRNRWPHWLGFRPPGRPQPQRPTRSNAWA